MTTTVEKIKIMQAWVDGEGVEVKDDEEWVVLGKAEPNWHWIEFEYRIKPKFEPPKEIVIAFDSFGNGITTVKDGGFKYQLIENDGWIPYDGKGQPVGNKTQIDVKFHCGEISENKPAGYWAWEHYENSDVKGGYTIIAYRVVK